MRPKRKAFRFHMRGEHFYVFLCSILKKIEFMH